MKNEYLEKLSEALNNGKGSWFDDEMLKRGLERNGYEYRKHRDSKGNEYGSNVWVNKHDERDYITNRQLTSVFNSAGYVYDKTFKTWIREVQGGKEILSSLYVGEINRMGIKRYCTYDEDYIDTPWSEFKISLHDDLINEIEECASKRGIDVDLYLEYILLKQLEKERPRKRDKIIEKYLQEEWECDPLEIDFIIPLIKSKGFCEEDITYYLDTFYYEYLKTSGYTENELNFIFTDVELPQYHYHCKIKNNVLNFKDIQKTLRYDEFKSDKEYEKVDFSKYAENKKFMIIVQKIACEFIKYLNCKEVKR